MTPRHARPWPAIDVAELRYALAFGSSVEEIADFMQRDVDDVRHQIELRRGPDRRATSPSGGAGRSPRGLSTPGTDRAGRRPPHTDRAPSL
jgi:hypothetical protein